MSESRCNPPSARWPDTDLEKITTGRFVALARLKSDTKIIRIRRLCVRYLIGDTKCQMSNRYSII